jgi:hypothetical protein
MSESAAQKKAIIETLFKVNECNELINNIGDSSFIVMRKHYPELGDDFFVSLEKTHGKKILVEKVKSLYDDCFSVEEIKELIEFWTSEIGKKLRNKSFSAKMKQIGSDWIEDVKTECLRKTNAINEISEK